MLGLESYLPYLLTIDGCVTCTELAISCSSGSVADVKWCQQAPFIRSRHVWFRHKNRTVPSESLHEKTQSCYSKGKKFTLLFLVADINQYRIQVEELPLFYKITLCGSDLPSESEIGVFSFLSHSFFGLLMKSICAATNSSSTGSLLSSDSSAVGLPMSPHPKILSEKPGKLQSSLTVWLACLESVTVAASEPGRKGQTEKNLSGKSTLSVKILILLRTILTFNLVSGWRLAVAVFNTVVAFLQLTFMKSPVLKRQRTL